MTAIDLDEGDAVVIIRRDMTVEAIMPREENVHGGSPGMIAAALMYVLSDPGRYGALEREFVAVCAAEQDGPEVFS